MKKVLKYLFVAFVLFFIIYAFIGITKMPANDMKSTIQKGDILIYRKFLLFPNHNDVVLYKSDYYAEQDSSENARYVFIQRIIGLPGDTIQIDSGNVFINHHPENTLPSCQKNYFVQLTDSIEKFNHLNTLTDEKTLISKKMEYAISLSENMYRLFLKDTNVIGISYEPEIPSVFESDVYPYNENIHWNKHFFGPLYLPKKGDKITLDKHNLMIYFPLIQEEEKLSNIQNDSLFINGKFVREYEFKNDYYFVMGDNRDNAIDSRYLGPVKRKDLLGIVFWKIN